MEIKRLVIKNFGGIEYLDFVPRDTMNCVSRPVANAICYILNNQFAIRHYNTVELKKDTYLFGEIYHYEKGKKIVYTTEINGFDAPVFKKNGIRLTDDEVDNDFVLTRPYREDNACIFSASSKDEFLDYEKFLPLYFSRLTEYAQSYKACLENRFFCCDTVKGMNVCLEKGKMSVYRRGAGNIYRIVDNLSQSDRFCAIYTVFLHLIEMVDFHCLSRREGAIERTPIVVESLLNYIDKGSVGYLLYKTLHVARQTFFVEKDMIRTGRLIASVENNGQVKN